MKDLKQWMLKKLESIPLTTIEWKVVRPIPRGVRPPEHSGNQSLLEALLKQAKEAQLISGHSKEEELIGKLIKALRIQEHVLVSTTKEPLPYDYVEETAPSLPDSLQSLQLGPVPLMRSQDRTGEHRFRVRPGGIVDRTF